ncbi:MAG: hypothetical protein R3181_01895 [Rubricoccaceae bacterium]|nr:hypothetical protein [Rubricoccaceae bacterium]
MTRLLPLLVLLGVVAPSAAAQLYIAAALVSDRDAAPGDTYEDVVPIVNPTDEPRQAKLYVTDYRFNAAGQNWYDEPGTMPRSNATWVAFGAPTVTIPPNATLDVPYQVSVPEDATLSGTYWSMLMVEEVPKESAESTLGVEGDPDAGFGVRRRIRYGVQVASHIRNTGALDLAITQAELLGTPEGGRMLRLDVENTGTRSGETRVYLDLFTVEGESVGRFDGSRARIYPGTSFRHSVPLDSVAAGGYEALIVVDAGDEQLFGAQYTLEL